MTVKPRPPPKFGLPMRKAYFPFSPSYTPLNHGSFGAYPSPVQETQNQYQKLAHERPDTFIVYDLPGLIDGARKRVVEELLGGTEKGGVDVDEVVLVNNATTGINVVLRNLKFEEGDVIVYFNTIYSACEKSIASVAEMSPVGGERVELNYPVEDDDLVELLRRKVVELRKEGKRVRLAMFDTVLTFPGVRMPWERLVEVCREMGVLSLIDGAHGSGHIDLTQLGRVSPDFFVSNCHKWLYTPRGCAIFYVPFRNQHLIRTCLPTSHGYQYLSAPSEPTGKTPFVHLFEFVATIDYTPYICIPSALDFRKRICGGEEGIRKYCWEIARVGGKRVAEILGTEVLDNRTGSLTQCCFANVRLPLEFKVSGSTREGEGFDMEEAGKIGKWLNVTAAKEFDTYLQIAFVSGALWVRLSGQIYLELGDFEWVGLRLRELCNRLQKGEVTV